MALRVNVHDISEYVIGSSIPFVEVVTVIAEEADDSLIGNIVLSDIDGLAVQ
jgi:hypothetical protein